MEKSVSPNKFTLIGVIAVPLWASSIPLSRYNIELLGPYTATASLFSVSGILGLILLLIRPRSTNQFQFFLNRKFYWRALFFAVYVALLNYAINCIDRPKLPIVILLNYMWPTITMVLSVWLLEQAFRPLLLFVGSMLVLSAIGTEIVGESIFSLVNQSENLPTILIYFSVSLAALLWGLYSVFNRKWGVKAGRGDALPFIFLFTALIAFLGKFVFHEISHFTLNSLLLIFASALASLFANICWDIGTRKGNINLLSLFADFLPWGSLFFSALFLGVEITSRAKISAVVVVIGALISRWSLLSAKPKEVIATES